MAISSRISRENKKAEIETVARDFVQKENEKEHILNEIYLLYYLSGRFYGEKLYLCDVLDVVRTICNEGLIKWS